MGATLYALVTVFFLNGVHMETRVMPGLSKKYCNTLKEAGEQEFKYSPGVTYSISCRAEKATAV